MGFGRLGFCAAAGLAACLCFMLTACDPEQMGGPPPGSPPGPQATRPQARLGIQIKGVEFDPTVANGGASRGTRVELVVPEGPAEAAGLREGDIVLTIGGRATPTPETLVEAIQAVGVNKPAAIVALRDGQPLTLEAVTGAQSPEAVQQYVNGAMRRLSDSEQAASAAEAAGDRALAFRHNVKALQFIWLAAEQAGVARSINADGRIDAALVRLAALLPSIPPPRVPAEADRHNRRAIALLQASAGEADNERAARAFADAIYEAPWIADLWLNAGLVLEKSGSGEAARSHLRRYIMLNPQAPEVPAVRQKIAALELLAEEQAPWRPFVNTYTHATQAVERITLVGRELVLSSVSGATPQHNRRDKAGDVVARATIRGKAMPGKWISRSPDPDEIRCFGAVYDNDAEFVIENQQLVIYINNPRYQPSTCTILDRTRIAVRRFNPG